MRGATGARPWPQEDDNDDFRADFESTADVATVAAAAAAAIAAADATYAANAAAAAATAAAAAAAVVIDTAAYLASAPVSSPMIFLSQMVQLAEYLDELPESSASSSAPQAAVFAAAVGHSQGIAAALVASGCDLSDPLSIVPLARRYARQGAAVSLYSTFMTQPLSQLRPPS